MKKLALLGYGKMGKMIASLAEKEGLSVVYINDGDHPFNREKLKECDVAIDFSVPTAAFENVSNCIKEGIPVISGTTGWLDKLPIVRGMINEHPDSAFMYGSNYSIGANIFFLINTQLAKLASSQDYALEITETHHTTKLDSPSGTAISLANDIISQTNKDKWINEESDDPNTVPIISIRETGVKGTHVVQYKNEIDEITIEHRAFSREGFALGALKAAKWLINKNGFYNVQEFIKDDLLKS